MPDPDHPLDRPVWSALTSRWSPLAQRSGGALRLAPDYGPFAASADLTTPSLQELAAFELGGAGLDLVETAPVEPPAGMSVGRQAPVVQMMARQVTPPAPDFQVVALTDADAAEMLALAQLTQPGPFAARTHRLGAFIGVKHAGRLVAMAGERMNPAGFTEVSGVCTHPDHRGRGYAGALMRLVARGILDRGETPFLHVYETNTGAIALYRKLGFEVRRTLVLTVLQRG